MPISQVEIVAERVGNIEDHTVQAMGHSTYYVGMITHKCSSLFLFALSTTKVEAVACFVAIYDMRWTKQNNIATNLNSLMDCETYQVLIHSYS